MPIKILSVDDELDLELLLTQYFRRKIRKGEYEFTFAHNGVEALELIVEKKDFDIILSDINMPEMDGLTLLTKVNEMRNPALKCIMVSAYGDMRNIRSAMNNGAFDFATKPIDLEDLSMTIEKAIDQINYVKEAQKEHSQLESIKNELAAATEIQQAILPRRFPPFPELQAKVDIFAYIKPAKDVGGDFYDFFQINEDHVGFIVADVSGKGLPAALFMAVSRTLMHSIGLTGCTTHECISRTNRLLSIENEKMMFVTMFYGILNVNTGMITYTNAGHNAPYILRSNNTVECLESTKNMVVGCMDGIEFKSDTIQLGKGDSIILYTDGVTEAFNNNNDMFDETGLEKTLKTINQADSKTITHTILEDLEKFVDGAPQSDDITVLVLKYQNEG
ncbi:MAG: SpoIIE family protein phosphatase [Bacteroidaceae bacterium]|nr:SpoIIE family protein phosphatase [Bacteroidaceae bacterium]